MPNIDERSKLQKWFENATFTGVAKLTQVADKCNERLSAVSLAMQDVLCSRSQRSDVKSCPKTPREPLAEWNKDDECEGMPSKAELRALRKQRSEDRARKAEGSHENPHYKLATLIEGVRRTCGKDKLPKKDAASDDDLSPMSANSGGGGDGGAAAVLSNASSILPEEANNEHVTRSTSAKPRSGRLQEARSTNKRINNTLRAAFQKAASGVFQMETVGQEHLTREDIFELAHELDYPPEEVVYVKKIFDRMDLNGSKELSADVLEKAVCHLSLGTSVSESIIKRACKKFCRIERADGVGFREFLKWFAQTNFQDADQEAAHVEEQARKHQMTHDGIRQVKVMFDSIDVDKSGDIQLPEFRLLLARILHIPRGIDMPECHINHLWQELDTNGDNKVTLEEFLPWWVEKQSDFLPYENLYANVRNLGKMKPDPPAFKRSPSASSNSSDDAPEAMTSADMDGLTQRFSVMAQA